MDNFNYVFGYMMERAMTMVAYCTLAAVVEKTLKAERERFRVALGHEPTQENWRYYYELQLEKTNRQNAHQRENDRKKLRRLVFGEDDSDSKAS